MRRDALRDFELNHDVDRGDLRGPLKQMMQDWRGDVVGKISVNMKSLAAEFANIRVQHVAVNNFDVGPAVRFIFDSRANSRGQVSVGFHGHGAAPRADEELGYFPVARADFDPGFIRSER